jgi:hypothetical protein
LVQRIIRAYDERKTRGTEQMDLLDPKTANGNGSASNVSEPTE